MSQDPAGLGPDSNPYRYCGNGPTDGTDASGLWNLRDTASLLTGGLIDSQAVALMRKRLKQRLMPKRQCGLSSVIA